MNELEVPEFPAYVLDEVKPHTFIYEVRNALSPEICRNIIERFEANKEHHYEGRIGQRQTKDHSIKKSTDMTVSDKPGWAAKSLFVSGIVSPSARH